MAKERPRRPEVVVDAPARLGVLARLRARLRDTRLVRTALATPVDPALYAPPPPRIVAGLLLLGASYLLGWPAIALLGAVSAWKGRPVWLIAGPVLYGLSWAVFAVGLALLGKESLGLARAFGRLALRRFAERFLRE